MIELHPIVSFLETLRQWWPVLSFIGLALLSMAVLYLRQQFPTRSEFAALKADGEARGTRSAEHSASLERRVAKVEYMVDGLPTREEFHRLSDDVGRVEKGVAVVAEQVKGMDRVMTKIDGTLTLMLQNQLEERKS